MDLRIRFSTQNPRETGSQKEFVKDGNGMTSWISMLSDTPNILSLEKVEIR